MDEVILGLLRGNLRHVGRLRMIGGQLDRLGLHAVLRHSVPIHQSVGRCSQFIDAIAARAEVSRSTVENAIRRGRELGLISVEGRRVTAFRNDGNVVRVISPEWRLQLAHGRQVSGVKKLAGTHSALALLPQLRLLTDWMG